MITAFAAAIAAVIAATPAAAQWDPGMVAQGQVLSGTARGYAERGGWRDRDRPVRSSAARDRRTCSMVPMLQRRHGARDPRVLNLIRACRAAGYR